MKASTAAGRQPRRSSLLALAAVCAFASSAAQPARARQQKTTLSDFDRQRVEQMLADIKADIKKYYYDPTFRGKDIDAHFKATEEKLKQSPSLDRAYRVLAQALVDLEDSHTWFDPPVRPVRVDYGWRLLMIGDRCYLTGVKPKSDAEAKGLKPGDQIVTLDGYAPTRDDLWKMKYLYYRLSPRRGVRLVVQGADGKPRQVEVLAKVFEGQRTVNLDDPDAWTDFERQNENTKHLYRHRHHAVGDLFIWKMPQFDTPEKVDEMVAKARKHGSLIIDLRGNGGGDARALQRLVGHFFEQDVKIADLKGRKEAKPFVAKGQGANAYRGKLVVLVDSESFSASEVFARVMQLEKRATIVGDATAGAVMLSRYHQHQLGADRVAFYGVSVTELDLIMKDGVSLERVGVKPDVLIVPTAGDLAALHDPVLARAAALLGVQMTPQQAGALFPAEWSKE